MDSQKQFVGFLSSAASPGDLSLTISSLTQALLWAAGAYAVMHGLDSVAVTSQVQSIIDQTATIVTAGMTIYHTGMTLWGLLRKLLYTTAAKPVLTVSTPVAVPAITAQ